MDLNELQAVRSRERQSAELQELSESFYQDVGEYVAQLERERDRAAEAASDPFADPEVRRLSDDIDTAQNIVEAVYDRRMGKVVKRASLAAAEMGHGDDPDGLTREEREAFEAIVDTIRTNRTRVLDHVVEGESGDEAAVRPGAESGSRSAQPETDPATTAAESVSTETTDGRDDADTDAGPAEAESRSEAAVDVADLMGDAARSRSDASADDDDRDAISNDPAPDTADHSPRDRAEPPSDASAEHGPAVDREHPDRPPADAATDPDSRQSESPHPDSATDGGAPAPERPETELAEPATGRTQPSTDGHGRESRSDAPDDPEAGPQTGAGTGATDSVATDTPSTGTGQPSTSTPEDGVAVESEAATSDAELDRTVVRVTADVGEILGAEGRTYDLQSEDVAALPTLNADALIDRDAAEGLYESGQ